MKRIPLLHSSESFFLIEILPRGLQAVLMSVNDDKQIFFGKEWKDAAWTALASRLGPQRFATNVVIAADSSLAYTAIVPIRILRENPNTTLYAVELENLLAKEVGRVFSACRAEAGKILGVDDLDVVLANSRVTEIKLDGHRILQPVGVKAAKLEAVLELSLTTRELFESIKAFGKNWENYYFTEIGRAELLTLARIEPTPLHVLRLSASPSLIMKLEQEPLGHALSRRNFGFDEDALLRSVSEKLGVSSGVSRELYLAYSRKNMAPDAARFFEGILRPFSDDFLKEIGEMKLRGRMFIEHELPLPLELPIQKGRLDMREPPLPELLTRAGFECPASPWPEAVLFRKLAPFLAFYYDKSDTVLNRWLKRHLSWLGAPGR